MRETWYVLEDGNVVDPAECSTDDKGVISHASGVKVAMRMPDCPMSRSVDVDAERAKAEAAKLAAEAAAKDIKPEKPKGGYKTRDVKSSSTDDEGDQKIG